LGNFDFLCKNWGKNQKRGIKKRSSAFGTYLVEKKKGSWTTLKEKEGALVERGGSTSCKENGSHLTGRGFFHLSSLTVRGEG